VVDGGERRAAEEEKEKKEKEKEGERGANG